MPDAIYCQNGHFVGYVPNPNGDYSIHQWQKPAIDAQLDRMAFCTKCGAQSIDGCLSCETAIERWPERPIRPSYCGGCGKPFPWTERTLQAAKEYTDDLELNNEDKLALERTFDDLTVDTPRTELAAHQFIKYLRKIAPAAGDALKSIIANVATEAAKKMMGL